MFQSRARCREVGFFPQRQNGELLLCFYIMHYITYILFGLLSEAIKYFFFIVKANKGILKKKNTVSS